MPSSATVTGVQTCALDRKSTRLNSSHGSISYAVFCLITQTNTSTGFTINATHTGATSAGGGGAAERTTEGVVAQGVLLPKLFFFFKDTGHAHATPFPWKTLFPS